MKNIVWMQPVIIDELRFHSASDAGELGTDISEQGCFAQRDVESFDSNFEIKDGVPYSVKTGYAVYDSSYSLAAHGAMDDQASNWSWQPWAFCGQPLVSHKFPAPLLRPPYMDKHITSRIRTWLCHANC